MYVISLENRIDSCFTTKKRLLSGNTRGSSGNVHRCIMWNNLGEASLLSFWPWWRPRQPGVMPVQVQQRDINQSRLASAVGKPLLTNWVRSNAGTPNRAQRKRDETTNIWSQYIQMCNMEPWYVLTCVGIAIPAKKIFFSMYTSEINSHGGCLMWTYLISCKERCRWSAVILDYGASWHSLHLTSKILDSSSACVADW